MPLHKDRPSVSLVVWTFNLRTEFREAADGPDGWSQRRQGIATLLQSRQPALVCVQEATESMLTYLVTQRGMEDYTWAGTSRRPGLADESAGVLFNQRWLKLQSLDCTWLAPPETPRGEPAWDAECPRTLETLIFKVNGLSAAAAGPAPLCVFNTHLDHVGIEARMRSAEVIAAAIVRGGTERPDCPHLLCGDFNSPKGNGNKVYELLTRPQSMGGAGLVDAMRGAPVVGMVTSTIHKFKGTGFTATSGDGTVQLRGAGPTNEDGVEPEHDSQHIDWVLWRDSASGRRIMRPTRCEVVKDRLPNGRWPSDHFPVSVTFDLVET